MTTIEPTLIDNVLVLSLSGEFRSEEISEVVRKCLALTFTHDSRKVLIDKRALNGRLLFTESYHAIDRFGPFVQGLRMAFLETDEYRDVAEFQDRSFRSQGYSNCQFFYDFEEAIGWLHGGHEEGAASSRPVVPSDL